MAAGSTSFSVSHQYLDDDPTGTPVDEYSITLTLTDDDTGSATANTYARVYDAAPTVTVPSLVVAHEAETVTITGAVSDPGTLDTFTLEVDWADGSVETYSYTAGTTTFSVSHTYLDDDPSGTPYDDYAVSLTMTDDDTLATTAATTVRVYNVDPSVSIVASGPVSEGGSTTVAGVISDPGTLDTFVLTISWGDGSNQSMTLSAGSTSFSASHTYVDDDPSGTPWDNYTIAVAATDDDTGVGSAATFVTVENVAPSLGDLSVTSPIVEGDVATLSGTWTDPGAADTFTLVVDWGDGTSDSFSFDAGTTSFSESHRYRDDDPSGTPFDSYTITVTLTDDDTGDDSATATVVVNNVDPALGDLTITSSVGEDGIAVLSGTIRDPGALDTFVLLVDWGDGTSDSYGYPAGVTGFAESHRYLDDDPSGTAWDAYTVSASVEDDDTGASETRTASITVYNTPPGVDELAVTGPIDENGAATLTGKIVDPGTQDGVTLFIDWGDGASGFYPYDLETRTFSHAHQYMDDDPSGTPSDVYTISVTVTDDDTGTSTTTTSVVVQNLAPSLGDVVVTSPIVEDGTATVTGTISDPGTLDSFTLVIDWGDGARDTYSYAAGTSAFSESHQYLDDDPTATAADDYTIALSLADDDTGSATATATLTVQNLDPADLTLTLSADSINENDMVTLGGSFSDAGTRDTHKVVIDWGDGSPTTPLDLAVGVMSFNADHRYLDDNPTATASDAYTIQVTVSDDDGGSAAQSMSVVVNNVEPTLSNVPNLITIDENGTATLTGTINDPGTGDTFTLSVDWGEGAPVSYDLAAGATSFSVQHKYVDDGPSPGNATPSDDYAISITLKDDDTGVASANSTVRVYNVDPLLAISATEDDVQAIVTLVGQISDAGTQDEFTLRVNWGDGSPVENFTYAAGTTDFTETHQYAQGPNTSGTYTIIATLMDDDAGADRRMISARIGSELAVTMSASDSTFPHDDGIVCCGDKVAYLLQVANNGPKDAPGVQIVDKLPAGVTYDAGASSPQCSGAGTITCDLGTLGAGQGTSITIVVSVNAGTAGTLINIATVSSGFFDPNNTNNTAMASVVATIVSSLTISWDSYSALDPNPNANGGLRIFADRNNPADTNTRFKVLVRATLTPPMPGVYVYFRSMDVDDPSTDLPPIDPWFAGDDNTGGPGDFGWGSSWTSASTMSDGSATVEFFVTSFPGDNFRVAASCKESMVNSLQVDNPSDADWYVQPGAAAVSAFSGRYGEVTDLLTVWRRLWVEVDRLPNMPAGLNVVTGAVVTVDRDQGDLRKFKVVTTTSVPLEDDEDGRFAPGVFVDSNGRTFDSTGNIVENGILTVFLTSRDPGNDPPAPAHGQFTLVDDDGAFAPPATLLTANVASEFRRAYIHTMDATVEGLNATPTLPTFALNAGGNDSVFDAGADLTDHEHFWASRVIAAFQPERSKDGDPNEDFASKSGVLGQTRRNGSLSVIYLEPIREVSAGYPGIQDRVVLHEMGHVPSDATEADDDAEHAEGGVMTDPWLLPAFSDQTLRRIRTSTRWQR